MRKLCGFVAALLLGSLTGTANAYDWGPVSTHVTVIDASYIGAPAGTAAIYFQVDAAVGGGSGCAANTWLLYTPVAYTGTSPVDDDRQMVNGKGVLSSLQLAYLTGKQVQLYGFNVSGGYCQVARVINLST